MVTGDEEIDSFFDNVVKISGAMFLLGTHYSVVKTLMTNPEWYAEKAVGTSKEVADFKENPSIKGLKQFLTSTCTTKQGHQLDTNQSKESAKQNLTALLESSEDEEQPCPKRTKKNKQKTQKETQEASFSAESSMLGDERPKRNRARIACSI